MRSWRGWSWDDGNFGGSGLEPQNRSRPPIQQRRKYTPCGTSPLLCPPPPIQICRARRPCPGAPHWIDRPGSTATGKLSWQPRLRPAQLRGSAVCSWASRSNSSGEVSREWPNKYWGAAGDRTGEVGRDRQVARGGRVARVCGLGESGRIFAAAAVGGYAATTWFS